MIHKNRDRSGKIIDRKTKKVSRKIGKKTITKINIKIRYKSLKNNDLTTSHREDFHHKNLFHHVRSFSIIL